jgi:hypothetical protein
LYYYLSILHIFSGVILKQLIIVLVVDVVVVNVRAVLVMVVMEGICSQCVVDVSHEQYSSEYCLT